MYTKFSRRPAVGDSYKTGRRVLPDYPGPEADLAPTGGDTMLERRCSYDSGRRSATNHRCLEDCTRL